MRLRIWLAALLIAAGVLGSRTSTPAAHARDSAPDQGTSSLDDQVDLAVTVYNSDIALVRDVRELQLPRGGFDLRFMDIAATVNPATVHFRSLTEPSRVSVLERHLARGSGRVASGRFRRGNSRHGIRKSTGEASRKPPDFRRFGGGLRGTAGNPAARIFLLGNDRSRWCGGVPRTVRRARKK